MKEIPHTTIGIDYSKLRDIQIISLDLSKLHELHINGLVNVTEHAGGGFTIKIERHNNPKDNSPELFRFNSFKAKVYDHNGCIDTAYCYLEISVKLLRSHNIVPLSVIEYRTYLQGIFQHLRDDYGITCGNPELLKFLKLEINVNVWLESKFKDYVRTIKTLIAVAPGTYRRRSTYGKHKGETDSSFYAENNQKKVKLYDKGLEQNKAEQDGRGLLRIEYTLENTNRIEKEFGTSKVAEFHDRMLVDFVRDSFRKDFCEGYNKLIIETKKGLERQIRKTKDNGTRHKNIAKFLWDCETVNKIGLIDVEDYYEIVKPSDKGNFWRTRQQVKKDFPSAYFNQHILFKELCCKILNEEQRI